MHITDPIKNFKSALHPVGDVTQWWGENPELYKAAIGINGHNGIDIVGAWGSPVLAVEDGIIADVKTDPQGFGKHIRLFSKDIKREWTYGHLSAITCVVGAPVKSGDILGAIGNSGFVVAGDTPYWGTNPSAGTSHPGTHLHFGLRLIKEDKKGWSYSSSKIKITTLNYDNGLKGSVNPLPYLRDPKLRSSMIINIASKIQDKDLFKIGEWMRMNEL